MVSAAMSESGDAAETAPFVADASERPFLPSVAPARRFWLAVSFVVSLSVHAVLFILLFVNFDPVDVTPAAADETPVEILTEPPPAAQPVAPPEEKQPTPPPPRTLEDTIATDAPRAANDEKTERDHARDKTAAPVVGKPSEVAASAPKTAPPPSFDEARAAIDPAQRRALYAKAWEVEGRDLPIIYLWTPRYIFGHTAKLAGFQTMPDGLLRLQGVSLTPP